MYSGFIVLSALVVLGHSMAVENLDLQERWTAYKNEHGKVYAPSEEAKRLALFKESVKIVEEHNKRYAAGEESYFMAINQFSDMTKEEFKSYTFARSYTLEELRANYTGTIRKPSGVAAPASIDWREQGVVTGVKNQGGCGSCWAFATTGSLESQVKIQAGKGPYALSEQQLVDCDSGNGGCNGGWMATAYDYIKGADGIELESVYPGYTANKQNCRVNGQVAVKISDHRNLAGNEGALQEACGNQGPIAVAIDVTDNFQRYGGGVFVDDSCSSTSINHGVTVVGYGNDGQDYWIVKNSWGGGWGEGGYIRMARNRNNMCAIGGFGVYPIVSWAQ